MITRRAFTAALGGAIAANLAGCTGHESGPATSLADLKPGARPDPNSDEAGLWLASDTAEGELRNSSTRIRDRAIAELIDDMVCRLSGNHCAHVRNYVVRNPIANASAMPNGCMQFWSGLLIRMKSESELAAIVGHELTHYVRRHSLARLRNIRRQTDFALLFGIGMSAAGVPYSQEWNTRLMQLGISSFSRENEYEADAGGLIRMVEGGYDPEAAPAVWRRFIKIREAGGEDEHYDFWLSTHPSDQRRQDELEKLVEKARKRPDAPNRLRQVLAPIRFDMLGDEVNMGTFKRSLKLFDILLEDDPAPGDILYHKGELYRRRAKDDDEMVALSFYHEACEARGAPPEAFRMVGLIRWRRGEKDKAREYFRRYLHVRPDAGDREMIRKYLAGA